jgi:putative DNA-invertase from lambdoid prophage Rac
MPPLKRNTPSVEVSRATGPLTRVKTSLQASRAAIYCRVSTTHQGTDRQAFELLQFADRAGYVVVGVFTEAVSGAKTERKDRAERAKVLDLARQRQIDVILVTELTRWGRSTQDLVGTLNDLQAWGVSLIAQTGLQLDMSTAQGKLVATLMATLAEFERDLMRERIKSGIQAAKARGVVLGRAPGFSPTQRKKGAMILALRDEQKKSIRAIARELKVSTATVQRVLCAADALAQEATTKPAVG